MSTAPARLAISAGGNAGKAGLPAVQLQPKTSPSSTLLLLAPRGCHVQTAGSTGSCAKVLPIGSVGGGTLADRAPALGDATPLPGDRAHTVAKRPKADGDDRDTAPAQEVDAVDLLFREGHPGVCHATLGIAYDQPGVMELFVGEGRLGASSTPASRAARDQHPEANDVPGQDHAAGSSGMQPSASSPSRACLNHRERQPLHRRDRLDRGQQVRPPHLLPCSAIHRTVWNRARASGAFPTRVWWGLPRRRSTLAARAPSSWRPRRAGRPAHRRSRRQAPAAWTGMPAAIDHRIVTVACRDESLDDEGGRVRVSRAGSGRTVERPTTILPWAARNGSSAASGSPRRRR